MGEILDELAERVRRCEPLDLSRFEQQYPAHAEQIRRLVPTIEAMAHMAGSATGDRDHTRADRSSSPLGGTLGDFRIVREVGRGGMGVVYEAEQVSLHRKVALKVLPFAAVLDPRNLQRFKNESLAAAQLDHPHIVDVYGVGCERGVHHYAMRFIEGQTLAQVIAQLRNRERNTNPVASAEKLSDAHVPTVISDQPVPPETVDVPKATAPTAPPDIGETGSFGGLSTDGSVTSREFFRSVATLGRDVASALEYAHERGVVHRDIKPGNIMVDGDGKAWVTDFGLAHIESDVSLTLSGDVLGTLRYMSPEQALGKRGAIDHRTDVYSLAITLYELLTLQPAYPQTDRQQLLQRIATEDPTPPRQLRPQIPADLETIVLKATAKNPQERYETAGDLADDLQRFLDYQPIKARRPTLSQRMSKWALRHTGLIWSAAAILLVSTIALAVSTALILAAYQREGVAYEEAQANFEEAQQNLELAKREQLRADRERDAKEVQRQLAEERALEARRIAYVADMRLAFHESSKLAHGQAHEILNSQIPQPGQPDVRGIEWDILSSGVATIDVPIGRHDGPVTDIALFPDRRLFATSGEDGCVRIWDAETRSMVREFRLQDTPIYTVGVSPDGRWLAYGAGSRDSPELKPVTIIDAVTGEFLGETNRHDTTIRQVRFSPDGRYLASGSLQEKLSVWEFTDGVNGRSVDLTQPYARAENFVIQFVDNCRLLAEHPDRTGYRLWNVESGEVLRDYPDADGEAVRHLAYCSERDVLAYVPHWHTNDHRKFRRVVTLLDMHSGEEIGHIDADEVITSLNFGPDGSVLSVGYSTGRARRVQLQYTTSGSGRVVQAVGWHTRRIHNGMVTQLRTLSSNLIITSGSDGTVTLFSPSGGLDRSARYPAHNLSTVACLATSPDNQRLASAHFDGAMRISDHATGRALAESAPLSQAANVLAWSGDGTHLAAINDAGEFCCWRVDGALLEECLRDALPETSSFKGGLALSHNGAFMYIGDGNAILPDGLDGVHCWDLQSRQRMNLVPTHATPSIVVVSPDNRLLVSASDAIEVFEQQTLSLHHRLHQGGNCKSLLFAPDGRTLVAGYEDGSVRLWDAAEGRLIRTLNEHGVTPCEATSLYFSPDGRTLIAGDDIGRLRFWNTARWGHIGSLPYIKSRGSKRVVFVGLSPDGTVLEIGRDVRRKDREGPDIELFGTQLRPREHGLSRTTGINPPTDCLDERFCRRHVIDDQCDGAWARSRATSIRMGTRICSVPPTTRTGLPGTRTTDTRTSPGGSSAGHSTTQARFSRWIWTVMVTSTWSVQSNSHGRSPGTKTKGRSTSHRTRSAQAAHQPTPWRGSPSLTSTVMATSTC